MTAAIDVFSDASFNSQLKLAVIGFSIPSLELTETRIINENTNIRAELQGALWALDRAALHCGQSKNDLVQIQLYTDCKTVSELPSRRARLEASDFISKAKSKPLTNADLYRNFYLIYDLTRPVIHWIKGHAPKNAQNQIRAHFAALDQKVRQELRDHIGSISPR